MYLCKILDVIVVLQKGVLLLVSAGTSRYWYVVLRHFLQVQLLFTAFMMMNVFTISNLIPYCTVAEDTH